MPVRRSTPGTTRRAFNTCQASRLPTISSSIIVSQPSRSSLGMAASPQHHDTVPDGLAARPRQVGHADHRSATGPFLVRLGNLEITMNASASGDRRAVRSRAVTYVAALLLAAAAVLAVGDGCDGGREGERCNPSLSHNDCDNGLTCQQPGTCVESYCCPDLPTSSSSPSSPAPRGTRGYEPPARVTGLEAGEGGCMPHEGAPRGRSDHRSRTNTWARPSRPRSARRASRRSRPRSRRTWARSSALVRRPSPCWARRTSTRQG